MALGLSDSEKRSVFAPKVTSKEKEAVGGVGVGKGEAMREHSAMCGT